MKYWLIPMVIAIITIVLYFYLKDRKKKRVERQSNKAVKLLSEVAMYNDNIGYFTSELIDVISNSKGQTEDTGASIYTDDEMDKIRLYAYMIYKSAISSFNKNMKYKSIKKKAEEIINEQFTKQNDQ